MYEYYPPPSSAKVKNDELLLVVAFMVCRERFMYTKYYRDKLLLQLYSAKTLSAVVFGRGRFRVRVCWYSGDAICSCNKYEGWNFNSGNYLFTTDTK